MEPHLLLLTTVNSYRTRAFAGAADKLGIALSYGVDLPPALADFYRVPLALPFADLPSAVALICAAHAAQPFSAIVAVDDTGALLAAAASKALGLPHNAPRAAEAARNKWVMRQALQRGGVPVPWFQRVEQGDSVEALAPTLAFPVVVKPLLLSGSRGVIRADDPATFVAACQRVRHLLHALGVPGDGQALLVESYLPGIEVALEALLDGGTLHPLALFDKPDPLEGPFFEETLYITPSRLPAEVQAAIADRTHEAARALGLVRGPVHAELRINEQGIWLIEMAGRSIGGLCGSILDFGSEICLEALILQQAAGRPLPALEPMVGAAGVMMLPIPRGGVLRAVSGVAEAAQQPGISGVEISAPLDYPLVPLPEGESYLGFLFARAATPAEAEAALRAAHAQLDFQIEDAIPVLPTFGAQPVL